MAVYTPITLKDLSKFLSNYNIGKIIKFEGILEGVENTNYKIKTSKGNYILTIFEKRVNKKDLPFFISLQKHLSNKKIKCPKPIPDIENKYIKKFKNKNCVIMSFLKGKKLKKVSERHCVQLGKELANMHKHTKDFRKKRKNDLSQSNWIELFKICKKNKDKTYNGLLKNIEKELIHLKLNWPKKLPKGVIHADVFQDNVFYIKNDLSGLIDFYFACNDFYAYELAICINAWCFDKKINFDKSKYNNLIKGYQKIRKLSSKELKNLRILSRGAAMRFFLTRLHDQLFHEKNAFVKPKNPMEYYKILSFHQNNNVFLS